MKPILSFSLPRIKTASEKLVAKLVTFYSPNKVIRWLPISMTMYRWSDCVGRDQAGTELTASWFIKSIQWQVMEKWVLK